jgi:hypothetical protein
MGGAYREAIKPDGDLPLSVIDMHYRVAQTGSKGGGHNWNARRSEHHGPVRVIAMTFMSTR